MILLSQGHADMCPNAMYNMSSYISADKYIWIPFRDTPVM